MGNVVDLLLIIVSVHRGARGSRVFIFRRLYQMSDVFLVLRALIMEPAMSAWVRRTRELRLFHYQRPVSHVVVELARVGVLTHVPRAAITGQVGNEPTVLVFCRHRAVSPVFRSQSKGGVIQDSHLISFLPSQWQFRASGLVSARRDSANQRAINDQVVADSGVHVRVIRRSRYQGLVNKGQEDPSVIRSAIHPMGGSFVFPTVRAWLTNVQILPSSISVQVTFEVFPRVPSQASGTAHFFIR